MNRSILTNNEIYGRPPTIDELAARLTEATHLYRETRDRVALLTMVLLATKARTVYPRATHIGMVPTDQDASGAQWVTSVIAGREVLAYDGDAFNDIPADNLDDVNSHVWLIFTVASAFEHNDLGTKFLKIDEVLSIDI